MLVADGAMGTILLPHGERPARLNLTAPELVLGLHRQYLEAGARLLVANTLGASPEEAEAGLRLARQAVVDFCAAAALNNPTHAARAPLIAGSLRAEPSPSAELVQTLAEADVLILETVTSLAALEAAVETARKLIDKPIWATLSFDRDGLLENLTPQQLAYRLPPLEAFGYGCGFGPEAARPVLQELRAAAPNATLIAKPNLGLPPYRVTPEQLADWAGAMARLGANVIGACCGSTPAHIQALADRLDSYG
jgi:5-methyltetrahydrofolate--homocysteine methyltransferase